MELTKCFVFHFSLQPSRHHRGKLPKRLSSGELFKFPLKMFFFFFFKLFQTWNKTFGNNILKSKFNVSNKVWIQKCSDWSKLHRIQTESELKGVTCCWAPEFYLNKTRWGNRDRRKLNFHSWTGLNCSEPQPLSGSDGYGLVFKWTIMELLSGALLL